MRAEDFQPEDLFAQIQCLVERLAVERCAREAAEAADKAKSELLAMVGHELTAPVETLIAMIELLSASPLDPAQRRYTDMLAQSARGLVHVLDDILDFTRLEAGRFELDRAPVRSARADARRGLGPAGARERQGTDERRRYRRELPARSSTAMRRASARSLMSLIDNALKFTTDGSVRLHASAIDVDGLWRLRFDVTDTGSGHAGPSASACSSPLHVPSATVSAIWRHRARAFDRAAARQADGRRGRLRQRGRQGQPLLVHARRRLRRRELRRTGPQPRLSQGAEPAQAAPGHVLVVEDNAVNRMLIADLSRRVRLEPRDGRERATALLSLASKRYDLVLMDVMMPDLDGIETTKRIRRCMRRGGGADRGARLDAKKGDRGAYLRPA